LRTSPLERIDELMSDPWLSDIILVKDGAEISASSVDVFRSAGDACAYLEHWWVEERLGLAFTAAGSQVICGVEDARVVVDRYEPRGDGEEIVLSWLRYTASAILDVRRYKAAKGKLYLGTEEVRGVLPTSVEGLIAYIGFTS
jgi:hypothetical protein